MRLLCYCWPHILNLYSDIAKLSGAGTLGHNISNMLIAFIGHNMPTCIPCQHTYTTCQHTYHANIHTHHANIHHNTSYDQHVFAVCHHDYTICQHGWNYRYSGPREILKRKQQLLNSTHDFWKLPNLCACTILISDATYPSEGPWQVGSGSPIRPFQVSLASHATFWCIMACCTHGACWHTASTHFLRNHIMWMHVGIQQILYFFNHTQRLLFLSLLVFVQLLFKGGVYFFSKPADIKNNWIRNVRVI